MGPDLPNVGTPAKHAGQIHQEDAGTGQNSGERIPLGAPIILTPKPKGSLQQCVDYRNLNKLTILNKYPLRLMDQL